MSGPDRDFVDPNDLGSRIAGAVELLVHVLLVEIFDSMPVEVAVLGDILDGGETAKASDADGVAVGIKRIIRQPFESFPFHSPTLATGDAANEKLEVDTPSAAIEVADVAEGLVVEGTMDSPTHSTGRFF